MKTGLFVGFLVLLLSCGETTSSDDNKTCQKSGETTEVLQPYKEVADKLWEERDVDFDSCSEDAAADGELCTFQGQIIDFEDDKFLPVLAGTTARLFLSNQIDDLDVTCDALGSEYSTSTICYEGQADSSGRIDVPNVPCNTRVAIWTYKEDPITPVTKGAVEYNHWVADEDKIYDVLTISIKTYNILPGLASYPLDPSLGIVAGKVRDCPDRGVANVAVNLEPGLLAEPLSADFCGDDVYYRIGTFYFVDQLPKAEQEVTSEDGLFAFVNVPVGQATVFASGVRAEGGEQISNIGRSEVISLADTITVRDVWLDAF
ncbi:MAG: hypothetical protein QGI45_08870 [Myxococcota bacterium]|jgi:hypothetical protein|nr:hypothetical protein [Myxococcota bacterium]